MRVRAWGFSDAKTLTSTIPARRVALRPVLELQRQPQASQQQLSLVHQGFACSAWAYASASGVNGLRRVSECLHKPVKPDAVAADHQLHFQQQQVQRPQLPQRRQVHPAVDGWLLEQSIDLQQHHDVGNAQLGELQQQQDQLQEQQHKNYQGLQVQPPQKQQEQTSWSFDIGTPGGLTAAYIKLLKQHTSATAAGQLGLASSRSSVLPAAVLPVAIGREQHWRLMLHNTQQLLSQLQPHQCSLILYTAAKLGQPLGHDLVSSLLLQLQQQQLQLLPPAGLTNTLWGLAVVGYSPQPGWMSGFYAACSSRGLSSLNRHQLTNILWGLGKMEERPPAEWLQEVLAALRPGLTHLSPSELCNALWGLAQLGYRPSKGWAKAWFLASQRMLRHCTPHHLACIAGSLGLLRLGPCSGHWLRQYRAFVVQQLPQMRAADVATIMCGLAKRNSSQVPFWVWLLVARQVQLVGQQQQQQQQQQQRTQPVLAAALVGSQGEPQQQRPSIMTPADIAATVWALPRLLYPTASAWKAMPEHAALVKALAAASLPLLQACSAGELVQLAVGFAGLRFYPGAHWLKVHENAAAVKYAQMSAANRARLRAAMKHLWSDV